MTLIIQKNEQIVVPVLGMHRSGTSMFMRMLSLLGIDVGNNPLPSDPNNKAGYWEDMAFLNVNVNLVNAVGCDWRGFALRSTLLKIPEALKSINAQPMLSANISAYLENQFQSCHWGWKDPRTVLTFPFWHRLLGTLGYSRVRPIILIRHPVSCARSLAKVFPAECGPERYPVEAGIELWRGYYEVLMSYMEDDWPIVRQNDLLDQKASRSVLRRCCEYIEFWPESLELALESINRDLLSYQKPADEVIDDPKVAEIYKFLSDRARQQQREFDEGPGKKTRYARP